MRSRMRKRCLVMATVPAALVMTAVPAGVAAAAAQSRTSASGADQQYIVILHDQNASLGARSAARHAAVSAQQKPVISQLPSLGGSDLASTTLVTPLAFKPPTAQEQTRAHDSAGHAA